MSTFCNKSLGPALQTAVFTPEEEHLRIHLRSMRLLYMGGSGHAWMVTGALHVHAGLATAFSALHVRMASTQRRH